MLKDFEEGVKTLLEDENITTNKYFGELRNTSKLSIDINKLPLVYVDYTGNNTKDRINKQHSFSLYITHISYSKNENTRTQKHYDLYDLLEKIDKTLNLQSIADSEPIHMHNEQKIYDQVTPQGYLTVFKQDFSAILN